ncbi:MAG: rod shape-determining protein RodA [Verrucomicrobiota bacterium]|nr:rod shape-determining protein RodA [Verrucomicrobiota bacterium]
MTTWLQNFKLLKRMNWLMTAALAALMTAGVLFIYSASYVSEDRVASARYLWQLAWIAAGAGLYVAFAVYDYRKLSQFAPWLYAAALALLALVLFTGVTVYGARRWLQVYGSLRIQPSEVAKFAILLLLARVLSRPESDHRKPAAFARLAAIVGLPFVLILKEPDLASALILAPVSGIMMFVGGVPMRYLLALAGAAAAGALLIVAVLFLPAKLGISPETQERIFRGMGLRDYHRARIVSFARPRDDPLGTGWTKLQSEIAIGSGGIWGKGWRNGRQNILGYLPRSVTPTDFIYAVLAEETGFAGCVAVIGVFAVLLVCGMYTAAVAQDKMGCLLCVGVTALVFSHAFINMAMTVGLLPIAGIPLPLMSYGGTFMVVTMAGLGIVQSVHIRSGRANLFEVV